MGKAKGCWAASLGDCAGGISGEHLISQAFFPDRQITVQGLHWCKDAPKTVGLSSLTGNILCRKHNSDLSVLDAAIQSTLDTLDDSMQLLEVRRKLRLRHYTIKHFTINGALLERWCLKTLINIGFDGNWIIGEGSHAVGEASNELVKVAFGKADFQPKAGLYTAAYTGESVNFRRGALSYTPKTIGNNLLAGMFSLGGYRFFLNLLTEELKEHQGSNLFYRETKHWYRTPDDKNRQVRSHKLEIQWQ